MSQPSTVGGDALLTYEDLQRRLRVKPRTIQAWIRAGRFPRPRRVGVGRGRLALFRVSDIDAYVASLPAK